MEISSGTVPAEAEHSDIVPSRRCSMEDEAGTTVDADVVHGLSEYTPYLPLYVSSTFYESTIKHVLDVVAPSNTFSPTTVPDTVRWGLHDEAYVACVGNDPITLAVLGELVALSATIDPVTQRATLMVKVELLRDVDGTRLHRMSQCLGVQNSVVDGIFMASDEYRRKQHISNFFYDATGTNIFNSRMRRITVHDVCAGDLVWVECAVLRADTPAAATSRSVHYAIHSVTLLAKTPHVSPYHKPSQHSLAVRDFGALTRSLYMTRPRVSFDRLSLSPLPALHLFSMTVNTRKHKPSEQENTGPVAKRSRDSSGSETADDESITHPGNTAASIGATVSTQSSPVQGTSGTATQSVGVATYSVPMQTSSGQGTTVSPTQAGGAALTVATPRVQPPRQGDKVRVPHLNFLTKEMEYIPTEFLNRLLPILNFVDVAANRFSIGLMPAGAQWGPVGDGSGLDKYLCHEGRPLTLWMTGVVTSIWLTPTEGSRVSVGVRLLNDRDHDVARAVQFGRCQPAGDSTTAGLTTFASRFLSTRGEQSSSSFEDVFDATDVLGPWNTMDKISPDRIRKTDVVLVECYVRRFKSKDGGSRQMWNNWGVSFELLRVAQLFIGPGPAELMPDESNISL